MSDRYTAATAFYRRREGGWVVGKEGGREEGKGVGEGVRSRRGGYAGGKVIGGGRYTEVLQPFDRQKVG